MGERVIEVLESLPQLSRRAAEIFTGAVRAAGANPVSILLSGGSTPRELYALLAGPVDGSRDRIPWKQVHFFWGDERLVPPEDAQSNYRMVHEVLLSKIEVPAGNIHRVRTESGDAARAADDYEWEMRRHFRRNGTDEFPVFDLALLGMGADGHTASLFPGTEALKEFSRWVTPVQAPGLPAARVSVTYPVLNEARQILVLVSGADKARSLARALAPRPEGAAAELPIQGVHPRAGKMTWLVDRAAAAAAGSF